jgi:hypothetical protein
MDGTGAGGEQRVNICVWQEKLMLIAKKNTTVTW